LPGSQLFCKSLFSEKISKLAVFKNSLEFIPVRFFFIFFLILATSTQLFSQPKENYLSVLLEQLESTPYPAWTEIHSGELNCRATFSKNIALSKQLNEFGLDISVQEKNAWSDYFSKNKKNTLAFIALANYYLPMVDSLLKENNLPLLYRYLPATLSAFNTRQNYGGGAGLWHVYLPLGSKAGLKISPDFDERFDPEKSTAAAIAILKSIQSQRKNAKETLLEFAFGPAGVNSSIVNTKSYTRESFIQAFVAVSILLESANEFVGVGLKFPEIAEFNIQKNQELKFSDKELTINSQCLMFLNPSFTATIKGEANIKICKEDQEKLIQLMNADTHAMNSEEITEKIYHQIKSGETLSSIAGKYNVKVNELIEWNNLKNNNIQAGQKLLIIKQK
jgi:membrane-bound lytic murein transglycosylase D